ncbi:MAG: phage tail protein [Polyangiaceae bacterium]|nr:phage tail protein [Polyangiaceae bacterium]
MSIIELPALYVDAFALVASAGRLVVVNRDPGPDEAGVPIDTTLALELVDTGADGVDRASVRIWVNEVLAFEGGSAVEIQAGYAGPLSGVTQTADTLRVVLHPVTPLGSLETVSVRVAGQTAGGGAALDETYSFVVEDRTAPRVVGAQATSPRTVRLAFDEPVALPAAANVTITPTAAPAVTPIVVSATADGAVVLLTLDTEMTPDVEHTVVAAGVTDPNGNDVLAPFGRASFAGFRPARPPGRRFDLWQMLPKHNRRDDQTGDLWRFIACLQEVTDLLLADVDAWPDIFDLERAPEEFLDLILEDLGNPFPFELDALGKRRLASVLVEMYQQKGTAKGIQNAVRFFLGVEIAAITAFASDALVLGESELGIDWILGPSDRFALYAFNVEVGRILADMERRQLRAIVEYLKPAHTHFVDLVEPLPVVEPDHWELGLSELGVNAVLH